MSRQRLSITTLGAAGGLLAVCLGAHAQMYFQTTVSDEAAVLENPSARIMAKVTLSDGLPASLEKLKPSCDVKVTRVLEVAHGKDDKRAAYGSLVQVTGSVFVAVYDSVDIGLDGVVRTGDQRIEKVGQPPTRLDISDLTEDLYYAGKLWRAKSKPAYIYCTADGITGVNVTAKDSPWEDRPLRKEEEPAKPPPGESLGLAAARVKAAEAALDVRRLESERAKALGSPADMVAAEAAYRQALAEKEAAEVAYRKALAEAETLKQPVPVGKMPPVVEDVARGATPEPSPATAQQAAEVRERQLTFGDGPDQCPAWAPDGKRIAFHSSRAGGRDIWVVDAAGGEPTRLVASPADEGFPAWSPDGSRLAFVRHVGDARKGLGDLVVIDLASRKEGRITSDATAKFGVKWRPGGQSLIYGELIGSPPNFRTCIVELDVATRKRVEILKDYAGGVSASPDGGSLVFDSFDDKLMRRMLYVMGLKDRTVKPIVTDLDRAWFPDWSPDGKWIAFHAGRGGGDGIWIVRPDGSQKTRLTASGESGRHPAWSPNGKALAFAKGTEERANIWLLTFGDSRAKGGAEPPASRPARLETETQPKARIVGVSADSRMCHVGTGQADGIQPGMMLAVSAESKPPQEGRGKALLRVRYVGLNVSECEVLEVAKDNPPRAGDWVFVIKAKMDKAPPGAVNEGERSRRNGKADAGSAGAAPAPAAKADGQSKPEGEMGVAIPPKFVGTWVEMGDDGKEISRLVISARAVEWQKLMPVVVGQKQERVPGSSHTYEVPDVRMLMQKVPVTSVQVHAENRIVFLEGITDHSMEFNGRPLQGNIEVSVTLDGERLRLQGGGRWKDWQTVVGPGLEFTGVPEYPVEERTYRREVQKAAP